MMIMQGEEEAAEIIREKASNFEEWLKEYRSIDVN